MRVFLAVHPTSRLVQQLTTQLDPWRDELGVRWTHPRTWHLTLQFLGEWPEGRLRELESALGAACRQESFELVPKGLGAFPHLRSPRVLFLQMQDEQPAARLAGTVREIVEQTWPEGPQDRKPFRGHLTLARIKRPLSGSERETLRRIQLGPLAAWPVEAFRLVASTLHPEGPRYRDLAVFPMRKKGEKKRLP